MESEAFNFIVDISVENKSGQNLLNPVTPGYFKEDAIKLYWLVNACSKKYS